MDPWQKETKTLRLKLAKMQMKKGIEKKNHYQIYVENMLEIITGEASKVYKNKTRSENDRNNG